MQKCEYSIENSQKRKKGDKMDIARMKQFMKEHNLKSKDMAEAAHINEATWFRKVNRKGDTITVKEMNMIIDAFDIPKSEAAAIFFSEKLA